MEGDVYMDRLQTTGANRASPATASQTEAGGPGSIPPAQSAVPP
jgi:hypothetical protein